MIGLIPAVSKPPDMTTPSWQAAEKLVALLEKAIAPGAVVEHNVVLPVIGQERHRQCDVVLRFGRAPRDIFFIVEVQQRGSKPDINTFGGWVKKMEELGAAGLICVSEAGFPESIIEDVAKRLGPRVRLVTLDPIAPGAKWPELQLVATFEQVSYLFQPVELKPPEFRDKKYVGPLRVTSKTPIVSATGRDEDARVLDAALHGMMRTADPYRHIPQEAHGKWVVMNLTMNGSEERPMWIHTPDGPLRARAWSMKVRVKRTSTPVEMKRWSYTQQFHGSTLAWAASATFNMNGRETVLSMVFTPNPDGSLQMTFNWGPA